MKELFTEIIINASSDKVWDVLTDFDSYPEWNPFVRELRGDVQVGKRIEAVLQAPNQKEMKFRPRVIKLVPRREFRWYGMLGIRGLFEGEHIFEVHPAEPRKVRFVQREIFSGILARAILKNIEENTRAGFEQMNAALKERCES
ncbi:SRPBCC domain-containing protein [candidate division KSB1 bacterium]|nr:SRPBCC domain-containing protein [candidate division KSB1 bacterium]RQW03102.1 MAG: SRPBCC domain-containing protein [candidate division KSB1 bacterium]